MSEKLKPCPFCGGKPKMWVQSAFHYGDRGYSEQQHQITCTVCYAQKVSRGDELSSRDAIAAWNTRTPDTSAVELVRELVAALEQLRDDILDDDICDDAITKADEWLKKRGA